MERVLRAALGKGGFKGTTTLRSRIMSAIRSSGNRSTEAAFRLALVRAGIRGWKLRQLHVAGCPDFLFPREGVAVFLDGCFWHGCPRCGHLPGTNRAYWATKIDRNRERDAKVGRTLRSAGLLVVRFWEHEIQRDSRKCVRRLRKHLEAAKRPTRRAPRC